MFSYVIQLETTIHYISIFTSLPFYSWLIIRHESIFLNICIRFVLRKHPIRILIRLTSAPNSYSITSTSLTVFVLKIWKRIWKERYPIHIHLYQWALASWTLGRLHASLSFAHACIKLKLTMWNYHWLHATWVNSTIYGILFCVLKRTAIHDVN
jgi:hypothetical protein